LHDIHNFLSFTLGWIERVSKLWDKVNVWVNCHFKRLLHTAVHVCVLLTLSVENKLELN